MPDIYFDVDAALSEVPVNIMPLIDDTDFKTIVTSIVYDSAGMDLRWNFVTSAGAYTSTAVTPTTSGNYDWAHQGDGMYSIEITASGGASINNDTEGYGWFSGVVTGVLPFRGPVIGFRASGLNDLLLDSAYSTTRGLSGTALPNAAAEAAGGLYTRGTGAGQINQNANGQVDANTTHAAGTAWGSGAITAASIATGAIDADALAADAGAELADAFLNRDMSTGTDSGSPTVRTVRQAFRALRNKVAISAGTATIYKEDDSTASWTSAITTDAAAEPIIGSDPAS